MRLLELSSDIFLEHILPHLTAFELVALAKTCSTMYALCSDELLWHHLVLNDFNFPPDAVFRNKDWKSLYRQLLVDTTVYVWGENHDGRLGIPPSVVGSNGAYRSHRWSVAIPTELESLRGKGIIDIVVGGWTFSALDRRGRIWTWGKIDSFPAQMVTALRSQHRIVAPHLVALPSHVRIRSISCGRTQGIALAYDGDVWQWTSPAAPKRVILTHASSRVVQVVGNWGRSTVLTEDGALFIVPEPNYHTREHEETVVETAGVTLQAIQSSQQGQVTLDDQFVQIAGLENTTIALTQKGRVFRLNVTDRLTFAAMPGQFAEELVHFGATNENNVRGRQMQRFVSGSFRNFAVLTNAGDTLIGHQDDPADAWPEIIPSLQRSGVSKVIFGDYHYGALTTDGRLLTWGSYSNGALGHGYKDREFIQETPAVVETLQDMFVFLPAFAGWQGACLAVPRVR